MGTQDVQTAVKGRRRIVLPDLLHVPAEVRRIATPQPCQRSRAEGIIHESVGLPAQQIPPPMGVGDLVAAVLPHLAQQEAVWLLGLHGLSNFSDEVIGQLVRHIQSPAVGPLPQPVPHHGVLTPHDEVPIGGRLLVHRRQSPYAPPRIVVRGPRMEAVPVEIERILTLGRPQLRVEAFGVEVAAVAAGVVEYAVQQHPDAPPVGLPAQLAEVLLRPQHGVDAAVIGGVVAVIAVRLENGTQIQRGDGETLQIVQLGNNSQQASAEVVVVANFARFIGLPLGGVVPTLMHQSLPHHAVAVRHRQPAEPVGKDLIRHPPAEPVGGMGGLIHRQLPSLTVRLTAAAIASQPEEGAVGPPHPEGVPDQLRLHRCRQHTAPAIAGGGEGNLLLQPGKFLPYQQAARLQRLIGPQSKTHLGAAGHGAEGILISKITGIEPNRHGQEPLSSTEYFRR